MVNEVFVFDYDFPRKRLLDEWNEVHSANSEGYTDKRYNGVAEWWRVTRLTSHEYGNMLCEKLGGVVGKPRFYLLEKNSTLPFHVDLGTQCSINLILGEGDGAPVKFEQSGNEYTYKSALLNTSISHGVENKGDDRILFKISFMDNSFEDIKQRIEKNLLTTPK